MKQDYVGEDKKGNQVWGKLRVRYFNEARRQKFLVTVKEGFLYDSRGRPLNTTDGGWGKTHHALIVMDRHGRIFVSKQDKPGSFHHSSMVAGEPVAAAGTIIALNGVVHRITDASGHYRPDRAHTLQLIHRLQDLGVEKFRPDMIVLTSEK